MGTKRYPSKFEAKGHRPLVKKFNRKSFYFSLLILLLTFFSFQNCSSSLQSLPLTHVAGKLSGNGGGYEGKIAYYRFVPDVLCGGQVTPKEVLVFDQDLAWLYTNSNQGPSCQQTQTPVNQEEVGKSPFQNEFLIVYDFLYALYDFNSDQIPDVLAESLCRDNWDSPSFEIINHHNYKTGEATTRIYYKSIGKNEVQTQFDSATLRLLTPYEVNYQSFNQRLKFDLNLQQGTGEHSRKFAGQITFVDPTMPTELKVGAIECVTGGGLDSSIWPIKKVDISPTISNFFVHPSENDIYFEDRNPKHLNWWRPFVLKDETAVIDISSTIFKKTMYVDRNEPIENSRWMMLTGVETNGTPYFGGNAYIYRPDDSSTLRTLYKNQSLASFIPNQTIIVSKVKQLSEFEFGYWMMNRIYTSPNSTAQETYFYRIFNWKNLATKDYLTSKLAPNVAQRLYFDNNPWPKGTVGALRMTTAGHYEILHMDISARKEKIRSLPEIPNCIPAPKNSYDLDRFFISRDSQFAIIEFTCTDNSRKVLGLSLDNELYYLTGQNETLLWSSNDGETFIVGEVLGGGLVTSYDPKKIKIVRTQTGATESTTIDPHLRLSSDQQQFQSLQKIYASDAGKIKSFSKGHVDFVAGFTAGLPWTLQLKNLQSRSETTVCKNAIGEIIDLVNFSDEQLALVTFVPGQRIFIYEVSETESCRLINSAPVRHNAIRVLAPTKSGLGVAISTVPGGEMYRHTQIPDDVYFLNLDGRAPLHINLNNPEFGIIVNMQVSSDHSKLYILGSGLKSFIYQSLLWLKL